MPYTRRTFTAIGGATLIGFGVVPGLAGRAMAQGDDVMMDNTIPTNAGTLEIHPVQHASLALTGAGPVIYSDPVGDPAMYRDLPNPDLILITHEHRDHYSPGTLAALAGDTTQLATNPAVFGMLPDDLKSKAKQMANGDSMQAAGVSVEAVPAYNTTADRRQYHPQGRDNGYILTLGGARIYIAGDTEDIPEMRALTGIDLAFLPMNLPYTMTVEQAADAVAAFRPKVVYPYHYRGSDTGKFKSLVDVGASGAQVRLYDWYGA